MTGNPYESNKTTLPPKGKTDRAYKTRKISAIVFVISLIAFWIFSIFANRQIAVWKTELDGGLSLPQSVKTTVQVFSGIAIALGFITVTSALITLVKTIQIGFRKKDP